MNFRSGPRRFTGWHMAGILVAFFAVVIAVNMLMARYAIKTFGGTVVENSYVASQEFNGWLAQARAQRALGWQLGVDVDGARHVILKLTKGGNPITDAKVRAVATHPLGQLPEQRLTFAGTAPGMWQSDRVLPAGRWLIKVIVDEGGHEARFDDEVAR